MDGSVDRCMDERKSVCTHGEQKDAWMEGWMNK